MLCVCVCVCASLTFCDVTESTLRAAVLTRQQRALPYRMMPEWTVTRRGLLLRMPVFVTASVGETTPERSLTAYTYARTGGTPMTQLGATS